MIGDLLQMLKLPNVPIYALRATICCGNVKSRSKHAAFGDFRDVRRILEETAEVKEWMSEQKRQELAEVKKELAERDWFPATSGNLSIKVSEDPLRFLITASGKDKRKETEEDFLRRTKRGGRRRPDTR